MHGRPANLRSCGQREDQVFTTPLCGQVRPQHITQPPGAIRPHFNAEIDMTRTQFWSWVIVDVAMQIENSWRQRDDGAVRENQVQTRSISHMVGVFGQSNPQALVKRHPTPVMIAAHQIEFAVQQRNQRFGIFLFAQCQVAQVEDGIAGLDKRIPVFNDQALPAFTQDVRVSVKVELLKFTIIGRLPYK
jgi:hypothetical protein